MRTRALVFAALLLLVAPVALAATPRIRPSGVGAVKLGARHERLQAKGLVGRLRAGCPLGGPGARIARLRAQLQGTVELTRSAARRVRSIQVDGGATARGVGIGATIPVIRAAFPKARVVHATEETFGITLVRIPKGGGGRIAFAVDVDSGKVTRIGVPALAFCE